jgi:TetR/AcrR family transcriptional repressor of nem operon
MARTRNEDAYNDTRSKLLTVGLNLIRAGSYESVGINDVLRTSGSPKGSFYHYFQTKEAFGLEVAKYYHAQQLQSAKHVLQNSEQPALERLSAFFQMAYDDFEARGFAQGCLMCNLSTELADEQPAFQELLKEHWHALSSEIATCIAEADKSEIGLEHLSDEEAGNWLLNSWSGALTRMKAVGDGEPLRLFLKATLKKGN